MEGNTHTEFEKLRLTSIVDGLPLAIEVIEPIGPIYGVIQISHGMAEHKERYRDFMQFLSAHGYVVAIHDHRGHGGSVRDVSDLGYFYTDNAQVIVEDLHDVTAFLQKRYPGYPIYMFSHSMGTLVARNYLKRYAPCMSYLNNFGFPAYQNTECMFFPTGESAFIKILEALKNAKHYIFLEYFIIQDGKMWSSIYSILKEKAKQGVRIRVLYDDIGCFLTLPKNFPAMLHDDGIECKVFNPFRPILSSIQNNRDHRKILSVDGRIAITGGFNLADEYINEIPKHGYWKDTGILLSGEAAWSLTVMFLQMWDLVSGTDEDYTLYLPPKTPHTSGNADGFVQPYCDSPLDREHIGEHVYLQIINNAREYLYIYTPYLIVDDSMISALTLSAKSGVDVRIITPYHWDKHFVHLNTQAYYRRLIESGVKVYEYEPGFLHAKVFVSDDKVATVGSINMDYRSLYLHFECGVYLYKNNSIGDIKRDFLSTLKVSRQITLQECQRSFFVRLLQEILRLFAPLF